MYLRPSCECNEERDLSASSSHTEANWSSADLLQRLLGRLPGSISVDSAPLGRHPYLILRQARSPDRLSGLDLVSVALGGVDVREAELDGLVDLGGAERGEGERREGTERSARSRALGDARHRRREGRMDAYQTPVGTFQVPYPDL